MNTVVCLWRSAARRGEAWRLSVNWAALRASASARTDPRPHQDSALRLLALGAARSAMPLFASTSRSRRARSRPLSQRPQRPSGGSTHSFGEGGPGEAATALLLLDRPIVMCLAYPYIRLLSKRWHLVETHSHLVPTRVLPGLNAKPSGRTRSLNFFRTFRADRAAILPMPTDPPLLCSAACGYRSAWGSQGPDLLSTARSSARERDTVQLHRASECECYYSTGS